MLDLDERRRREFLVLGKKKRKVKSMSDGILDVFSNAILYFNNLFGPEPTTEAKSPNTFLKIFLGA